MSRARPRIAVIGVHGVADQQPYETARSVASLLHAAAEQQPDFPAAPDITYGTFVETTLHIRMQALVLPRFGPDGERLRQTAPPPFAHRAWRRVRAGLYSSYGARRLNDDLASRTHAPDYDFMYNQLSEYTGRDDPPTHQTIRLAGTRTAGGAAALDADVDVYEMYWADLSRLGTGIFRILGEFYQLLFHVSSLGKTTIDMAREGNPGEPTLKALGFFQSLSSWLLVVPIALLNLYLVLLAAGLVVVKVPDEWKAYIFAGVGAVVVAVATALRIFRRWRYGFARWSFEQVAGLAIGAIAALLFVRHAPDDIYVALALVMILLAVLVSVAAAARYDGRRPGALKVAQVLAIAILLATAWFVRELPYSNGAEDAIFLVGRASELVFISLSTLWVVLVALHLVTLVAGQAALLRLGGWRAGANLRSTGSQIERAVWTSRIALFVPMTFLLILTLSLWLLIILAVGKQLEGQVYFPMAYPACVEVGWYMNHLIRVSGGPAFNGFFVGVIIAAVMLVWAMFPAVLAERDSPKGASEEPSLRLGHWLDHGFRLMRWAGRVVALAAFVVFPFGNFFLPTWFQGQDILITLITLVGGSTVGLVALRGHLSDTVAGLRAPLDVALDVDNWLRERPLDANPRARICARYVSLLKHVCADGVGDRNPYDALVILAHSQGTVITADLLRFIGNPRTPRAGLERLGDDLPVYIFTVGCPLRQLYGRRFPHQYEWATHGDVAAGAPQADEYGTIPGTREPDPAALGAALWVNAFKSADYVGRHVWMTDADPTRWMPAAQSGPQMEYVATDAAAADMANTTRVELCLGAGAHTHYFDETGVRVGQILDQLIGVAITGKRSYTLPFPYL